MFKFLLFLCLLSFAQACTTTSSNKHVSTGAPGILDGAWTGSKCSCSDKDTIVPDAQSAHILVINGLLLQQIQIARWKNPEWNGYCSIFETSTIKSTASDNVFEVITVGESTFSPDETKCDTLSDGNSIRTWKILSINKAEFKYESTRGCENGPMICTFRRLDQ